MDVREFDRRVAPYRDKGSTVLSAAAKAVRDIAKERKQQKGGKR